ncbi:hypothetical protein GYMLUDRAFT_254732 [Collybiopsis luxurians FD-317 M1]|nr:hypothetical protein GYMLUDRAFT_254732 [Collybiopsis luxurians FD-317 M1]
MSSIQRTVVVTGASGYLGSYMTYQLLEDGYKVKGLARGPKVSLLKRAFAKYPHFEAVEIQDIATGDFGHFLKGVDAVIHCAAPMLAKADPETALKGAIDGTVHVLEQARSAGVRKVVVTGSMASFGLEGPFGPDDWNPVTLEQAKSSDNPAVIYFAQKKFGEKAVLEFGDKYPEMDVTIISPSFIFGPLAPGFSELAPTVNFRPFSSAFYLYAIVNGANATYPFSGGYNDIRDVVRAHIVALDAPPSSVVGRKRFALRFPEQSDFRQAIQILAAERPESKNRLPELSSAPQWPESSSKAEIDYERIEKVLGIKKDSFKSWRDTVLDGIDSMLAVENSWKAKGLEVVAPVGIPH